MPESGTNLSRSILPTAPPHVTDLRSARPAQSASAKAESTSRPFGKSSSFISRVTDKNRMRRFKAMRPETVGAETCLASCPTEYCKSGRSTDRNNKRPTCVRKYECSSRSSGVSSLTRSFTPAVAQVCQNRVLHNVLDQLGIDHQPESIDCPFQHPTQKFHQRLASLQQLHISQEHGVSHVFRQLAHLSMRTHNHVIVHVTHGPHALTHIAAYTGVSCALDQPIALFLDFSCVMAPGSKSALQAWQGLE